MKVHTKKESFFLKKFIQVLNQEMIPLEVVDTNGNTYSTAGHDLKQDIKHKILIKRSKVF